MKILQIVPCAYRATIEEQDDTILWLTQAMKNAGAAADVLLTGDAVNYALQGQDSSGLALGEWKQTQPPRIEEDLKRMMASGIEIYALADDMAERGLMDCRHVNGVHRVNRGDLSRLFMNYDRVWSW